MVAAMRTARLVLVYVGLLLLLLAVAYVFLLLVVPREGIFKVFWNGTSSRSRAHLPSSPHRPSRWRSMSAR
jgi:hypothetical protein